MTPPEIPSPPASGPISWTLPGHADDLALAVDGDRLWVAASSATLAAEGVWLGEVRGGAVVGEVPVILEGTCCRPALCVIPGAGVLALACLPGGQVAAVHRAAAGTLARWRLATDGVPVHVSAAAHDGAAWIAIEVARGAERRVVLAAVDPATGAVRERRERRGTRWFRWPELTSLDGALHLAWCEGPALAPGAVKLATLGPGGELTDVRDVSADPGEAPQLARLPDGRIAIAWHRGGPSQGDEGRDASVVRALEVALVGRDGTVELATPPAGAGGADPRGEDQGWELPAIAAGADGALWLVARSTHGHHVARRGARDGRWTAPASLCDGAWGGRGRRHALVRYRGEIWLARRAPTGIQVGPCPAPAAVPATIPAPPRAGPARLPPRAIPGVRFGDLHQHTAHSDGCGSFEDLWIAARDRRGLDFAAITDHDQFCRRALGPATWQLGCEIAAGFDDPGRFVALAAYEFTGPRFPGPGHKCVYFADRVPERVPERDVDALFALLRELGGICVPHHVGWTGGDFAHHDPAIQPVWEICSVHGCYEAEGACAAHPPRGDLVIPGQFVRDALDAGLRFGFIGSTDSHGLDWHHGIARWRNPFRAGLACVVGAEPTRAGIIAALGARRSYATSGARIGLHVEIDGAPMGSELPAGTRGELVVEVDGTAPVTKIALVHAGGERVLDSGPAAPRARARCPLPAIEGPGYAYVRIEQTDAEAAWASPFWIG